MVPVEKSWSRITRTFMNTNHMVTVVLTHTYVSFFLSKRLGMHPHNTISEILWNGENAFVGCFCSFGRAGDFEQPYKLHIYNSGIQHLQSHVWLSLWRWEMKKNKIGRYWWSRMIWGHIAILRDTLFNVIRQVRKCDKFSSRRNTIGDLSPHSCQPPD